jgi:fructose-1,6-bisphosphatase
MPTILLVAGWRFFFYSNERNEPVHIHAEKADKECKYWLKIADFEVVEVISYNLSPSDKREVKKIIYEHFDYIVTEWNRYFNKKEHGESL